MKVRIEVDFDANATKASISKWGKRLLIALLIGGVILLAFGIGSSILEKKKESDRQERYEAVKAYLDNCEKAKPPKAQVKIEHFKSPELLAAEARGTLTADLPLRLQAEQMFHEVASKSSSLSYSDVPAPIPSQVIVDTDINAPCQ